MKQNYARGSTLTLVLLALAISGCDKLTDVSRQAQVTTKAAFEDTKSSWKDFFTYHPPQPEPMEQTRYCYQLQSDIVCYDSEQPRLTAKLVGYQDGDNVSWVQPGGGSLGASGGAPVSLRPAPVMRNAAQQQVNVSTNTSQNYQADSGPMVYTGPVTASGASGTTGSQISVQNLTPNAKK